MTDTTTLPIAELDWAALTAGLDEDGFVQTPAVLGPEECRELAAQFEDGRFRTTVDMRRHRFGEGEYKYFDHPLPASIERVRHALYAPLAVLANDWAARLGAESGFPLELDDFLDRCHRAGQRRPTPLLLRYFAGGHNTLHQDLYGEVAFPLQAVTVLNRPEEDFEGGQFVLVEQRPRAQSRVHVIDLQPGAFLILPTRYRPVRGARGFYRATMRHGVATVRGGERVTLGIIFHDAT
ncbi:MAG: hypothetical protein JWN32_3234 [Solirubrobacterales bacterium]|nr:hypothetical protein [Solirubrobacterales bacterium]